MVGGCKRKQSCLLNAAAARKDSGWLTSASGERKITLEINCVVKKLQPRGFQSSQRPPQRTAGGESLTLGRNAPSPVPGPTSVHKHPPGTTGSFG